MSCSNCCGFRARVRRLDFHDPFDRSNGYTQVNVKRSIQYSLIKKVPLNQI